MGFGGLGGETAQPANPGRITPEVIAGLLSMIDGGATPTNLGGLIEGPVRNFPTVPVRTAPVLPPRPVSTVPRGGGGGRLTEGRGGDGGGGAGAIENEATLAAAGTVDTFEQWLEAVGIGMSLFGAFAGGPVGMLGLVGRGIADTQKGISPLDRFGGTLPSVAREQAGKQAREQEGAREQAREQAERTRAARARERESDSGDLGRGRSPTGSDIEGTPF